MLKRNIVKMAIPPKVIGRFNTIKIPAGFLAETDKLDPKIHMEAQGAWSSQNNLENEEQSWSTHNSWLQNLLQNYNKQTSVVLALGQTNRLELRVGD